MKKKECGQAFILVLIILAIGVLLVVPALRLTYTTLQSSRIIGSQNRGLYACEAAQELVMWKLYHGTLVQELPTNGSSVNFTVDVCGTQADVSVVMRAVELEGGVVLATENTVMPTKTVSPNQTSQSSVGPFTYTIKVKQVSSNTTAGLDVIYDIMSSQFKGKAKDLYVLGSSYISDDGISWQHIDDPKKDFNSNALLRWPATGNFSSPFRHFQPGQEKYLKFQLKGPFNNDNVVVCNWVVIQVGSVFTLSGPQAIIAVGNPPNPNQYADSGAFAVSKTCYPQVIPPLEPTDVTYTITIKNLASSVNRICGIDDFLPPGFEYTGPTSGPITNMNPYSDTETINGVTRQHLWWQKGVAPEDQLTANGVSVAAGANMTLTFKALATQGISGNYYNEVIVVPENYPSPGAFSDIAGFNPALYSEAYSWNSGIVIVPAYDSEAESEGVTVDANLALEPERVRVISWSVR